MIVAGSIKYLKQQEIDKEKWDRCIDLAANGRIYAYSFYLDKMSDNWDALVLDDYSAVMPLTWRKKWGVYYLYQPFLCAQLGVFGNDVDGEMVSEFLQNVPSKFKYWDIYLNEDNFFASEDSKIYPRANFVLELNRPYEELQKAYRENIRRNTRKANEAGCVPVKGFEVEKLISLALDQMPRKTKETAENANRFRKLYSILREKKQAEVFGISLKNELLASCAFFYSHHRAYYILVGNHPNGRTIGASHALIDYFIREHAGQNLLLDFEGSDIRNLAFFYSSFGAKEEKYAAVKLNRLPFFLKWIKS
jgi:hypothetical protein